MRSRNIRYFVCLDDRRASAEERRLIQQLSKDDFDEEYLTQKISSLQLRLDEAHKTIQLEREYVTVQPAPVASKMLKSFVLSSFHI